MRGHLLERNSLLKLHSLKLQKQPHLSKKQHLLAGIDKQPHFSKYKDSMTAHNYLPSSSYKAHYYLYKGLIMKSILMVSSSSQSYKQGNWNRNRARTEQAKRFVQADLNGLLMWKQTIKDILKPVNSSSINPFFN